MSSWGQSWGSSWLNSWGIVAGNVYDGIINANASTSAPNHYEICDLSGFRQYPGDLQETWRGLHVRQRSFDPKHGQENIKGTIDRQRGPQNPEPTEIFLADGEVTADDL